MPLIFGNRLNQLRYSVYSRITAAVGVSRLAPLYADDMSVAGPITGRANWTIGANGSNLEVVNGYAHNSALFGKDAVAVFGNASDSFVVTLLYNTVGNSQDSPWEQTRQGMYCWYVDASNYVEIFIDKQNGRLALNVTQGGNVTSPANWSKLTFKDRGEIKIICNSGVFSLLLDGAWAMQANSSNYYYPLDKIDLTSSVAAPNRKGGAGFHANTYRWPILYGISVEPLNFAITFSDDFVGRDSLTATGGSALVQGTFVASASPASWVARILDANTKAVVADWRPMATVTTSGQTMSGYVFLPTGGPYMIECGYIDGSDGKARLALTRAVWSGIRGETFGQSNSAARSAPMAASVKTSNGITVIGAGVQSPYSAYAHNLNQYQPNCMAPMASYLAQTLGKPVGIGVQGVAGVGIDYLSPAGAGWSSFTGAMSQRRGIVEFLIWDQGEGDADGASPPSYYANHFLTNLLPGLRQTTGNPNLPVFISPVGRYASTTPPNNYGAVQIDQQREALRQQYLAIVAADPNVHIADSKLGSDHGTDAYHYGGGTNLNGYPEFARREAYTVAKWLGVNVPDGTGAHVISAARNGAVVDLTLDLNGGTAITDLTASGSTSTVPTPTLQGMNGYQVSADNFSTTLAINTVARNGNGIRITLAADPGVAVKVRSFYGWSFDDTNLFYTTGYADGRANIPVAPIVTPVIAASSADGTGTGGGTAPSYHVTTQAYIDQDNDASSPAPWNNWQIGNSLAIKDASGATTNWTATTNSGWTPTGSGASTGGNTGAYPDAVLTSGWYSGSAMTITISGLDDSRFYDVSVMGSRGGTSDRATLYTIGSTSQNQINDNNTSTVTTFAKVKSSGGSIVLSAKPGTTSSGAASGYAYLCAMVVQEYTYS